MIAGTLLLAGLSVAIGFLAAPLFDYSERAAAQLLAVTPYVDAVLGAGGVDVTDLPPESALVPAPPPAPDAGAPVGEVIPQSAFRTPHPAGVAGGGS
jgi:hypothetical protein